ncbi:MAG: MFS transporter [Candidatus Aminicenantaceae bacterium]
MTEGTIPEKKKGFLVSFPMTYWVAIFLEFLERGAYYGLNAVLAVYLNEKLGFSPESVGFLQGFVYALTYVVPIAGGALAERYGYRRMLLFAFSLLTLGYFGAGNVDKYGLIFLFLLVMATGSGLFKPIVTGTVARTTTKENSGFGFGVYYWSINLGAFVFPLFVSWLKGNFEWKYIFFASAAWCALMYIPTIFFYKEPDRPKSTKTAKQTAKEAITVLSDSRFMLMILVYSCFWILYFQLFGSVLWYMRDFINRSVVTDWMSGIFFLKLFEFDAEFVTIINAGVIILLVLLISRVTNKLKPIPVIAAGVIVGSAGFVVLALTSSPWMFILGIAVFSLGEMTAHPKYYSYIGMVAPKDKVAVYMGYAFLYGVIGSLFGSNFGAILYERMLEPLAPPPEQVQAGVALAPEVTSKISQFWMIFAVLGVVCLIGMLLYNRFFAEDTPKTYRRAWAIMLGIYVIFCVAGIYFFLQATFLAEQTQWRMMIQSLILLALGAGGMSLSFKKGE